MSSARFDLMVRNVSMASSSTAWRPRTGWLACNGHTIAAVGAPDDPVPSARTVIDGDGGTLLPGLRNAHTHGSEFLARGHADGETLAVWLSSVWSRLDGLSPQDMRLAVTCGALLSIRSGVTSIVDHLRRNPMTDEVLQAAIDGYEATGIRALLAVMVRDRLGSNNKPVGAGHLTSLEPAARQIDRIARFAARTPDRIRIGIGPSASIRCTDDLLLAARDLSRDAQIPIHIHVAETQDEATSERAEFGMTAFQRLAQLGLLSDMTACAHCVWMTREDFEIMARSGAVAVHNPVSNLRLGSGIADLPALTAAGVPVAIGTDGAASNDGVDVWEALKYAALLPRRNGALDGISSETFLDMATVSGPKALGGQSSTQLGITQLEPGDPADFCIYPAIDAPFVANDLFASGLVLSSPRRPRHVVIDGVHILDNGAFRLIDEAKIVAEARQTAARLFS
ncbi:amidohydrolase family protein [Roseiarcaceae bacterium H3SJ34-1]|uniref:amidohydrolase family protein n=1 Tax=Terripilifer ovatus TaxID=3032367 RepID=UPI003AB92661|nr:amidohydrolase family protein [Roseiarcaceae bacterium H3SJ34-1]